MARQVDFTLVGEKRMAKLLDSIPSKMKRKELRKVMSKASTPILKRARALVPVRSGLLKKSLGKKVKTYKSGTVAVIIGARRQYVGIVNNKKHVPANIAHLVEGGHGGPRPAKPHPFLFPAYNSLKQQTLATMKVEFTKALLALVG